MGMGDLTLRMALIVAVGVFLASFTDAIAGGGGSAFILPQSAKLVYFFLLRGRTFCLSRAFPQTLPAR